MPLCTEHLILFGLLLGVFGFLLWGRVRYDLVAFAALILGTVPVDAAFSGFGHPATVIIALVLIVSRGLFNSGVVEAIARVCSGGERHWRPYRTDVRGRWSVVHGHEQRGCTVTPDAC